MKLELSKDEYRSLIDMIYIAEWVMNAHKIEKDPSTEKYAELEQRISSFADKMGYQDLIVYDEDLKRYFPTRKLEDGPARQYIEEYDNDSFWDELIERLIERDVLREIGEEKLRIPGLVKMFGGDGGHLIDSDKDDSRIGLIRQAFFDHA